MASAILLDLSALGRDDEGCLEKLAAAILAEAVPGPALTHALMLLEATEQPAALYEALCYRIAANDYWLHYVMWKVYRALGPGRDDAAFCHAATVLRLQPDWSGLGQAAEHLFQILRRRHREHDALALFRRQMQYLPGEPAAQPDVNLPMLQRLEPGAPELAALAAAPRPGACRWHEAVAQETRPPWTCPVFGGEMPFSLVPLTQGMTGDGITVAGLADAEVLIYRDSLVVLDRFGELITPPASRISRLPSAPGSIARRRRATGSRCTTRTRRW